MTKTIDTRQGSHTCRVCVDSSVHDLMSNAETKGQEEFCPTSGVKRVDNKNLTIRTGVPNKRSNGGTPVYSVSSGVGVIRKVNKSFINN